LSSFPIPLRLRSLCAAILLVLSGSSASRAEPAYWHHLHLGAPDTAQAAAWYAEHMDGLAIKSGSVDVAVFGETRVVFMHRSGPQEGSSGSSIDHVGWSFDNLDARMAGFETAGIRILQRPVQLGAIRFGFIEDPWGTKIEVMQDPELIGFHHVHLHLTDPPAAQEWYASAFGGQVARYAGILPAVKFDNMWLIIQKAPEERAATIGRSVDHIGWRFESLHDGLAHLAACGVEPQAEPAQMGALKFTFVEGAGGVRIEVLEYNPPSGALEFVKE
jgi:catechol 2,3-dioxygenase-like lactoylglutathione lyase family enzyme